MQNTSVVYKQIYLTRHFVEYKVEIAGQTYTQTDIYGTPEIASAVFDKFSIGNAPSATLKLTVKPKGTIPQMALVEVYFRLRGNNISSPWYPKGKYYIDTRKLNYDGYLSLECFDAMLKAEYTFMESGSWTSTTALATVQMIATDMGINIESNTTTILTNNPQTIPNVPVVGEDGTTGREMLCSIASMYGGNFVIDELGDLKLVQLVPPSKTINIGKLTSSLDTADAFDAIDRVILKLDEKTGYRSPESTFDSLTGRILEAYCPWTSQELADDLLSIVNGFVYQPYEANGAEIDPSCQLGDGVTVNGITSQIYSQVIHLDARCSDDISAPYEEEVNHEYPYRSPAQRKIDEAVTQEDLATAGRTTINGSNIHSGTITLGGDGNGEGELHILDADDTECGSWNNNGIVIYDNSEQSGSIYGDNKIRIIRQGDSADTTNALKMGVYILDEYPDFRVPYIELRGKSLENGAYVDAVTFISSQQLLMSRGNDHLEIKQYSSGVTTTATKTDSSSTANMTSRTVKTWGKVVQMTVHLTNANYAGAGAVMWEGDIEPQQGATLPQPVDQVTASGVNGANFCIGQLTGDSANNKWHLVIRAVNGYQSNWTANLSFTFLV